MDRTLARMPPGNHAYLAARGIHGVRQQRDLLCLRPSPAPFNAQTRTDIGTFDNPSLRHVATGRCPDSQEFPTSSAPALHAADRTLTLVQPYPRYPRQRTSPRQAGRRGRRSRRGWIHRFCHKENEGAVRHQHGYTPCRQRPTTSVRRQSPPACEPARQRNSPETAPLMPKRRAPYPRYRFGLQLIAVSCLVLG